MSDPKLKFILEVDDKGTAVVKSFSGGLDDAGKKTKGFSGELGGLAASAAGAVAKIAALGAATVTAVAGLTIKSAISEFAEFETQLVSLKNVGVTDLGAIKAEILALPPALGNATQMTAGYYQVLSSGITDAKQSIDTLVISSQLAKVAHIEQGTAVQAVTSGMKAFKASGDEVADSLMRIEKSGVTTVGQLAPIFGQVSGMASGLNMQLNETSAALAAVTQQSGSTEKGATQLMAIMQELIKPTDAMSAVFEKYGGTVSAIKQIGFEGVLREIATATGGTAEGIGALVGSSEALSGILTLTSNKMEFFNAAMDDQTAKAGSLSAAWEAYKNTLPGIWDTAKNFVTDQAILIGERLAPKIKEVVGDFIAWGEANRTLIETKIGEWIDGFVTSIGKVDFDQLATSVMSLASAMATVAGLVVDIVKYNPFSGWHDLILLAIGDWAGLSDKYAEGSNKIKESVTSVTDAILEIPAVPPFDVTVNKEQAVQAMNELKNQIESAQTAVSESPIEIRVNTDQAVKDVLILKDQIAAGNIAMPVDANLDPALEGIEYLKYKIEDEWFYINIGVNQDSAGTAAQQIKDQISAIQADARVSVSMGLNPVEALAEIGKLKEKIENERAILAIGGESELAEKELDSLVKTINKTESAIKILVDSDAADESVKDLTSTVKGYDSIAESAARKEFLVKTESAIENVEELTETIGGLVVKLDEVKKSANQASTAIGGMNESSSGGSTGLTPGQWEIVDKYYNPNATGNRSSLAWALEKAKQDPDWPTAETGGYLYGPSHTSGGIRLEAEGGEYIVNKRATAAIGRDTLDRINAMTYASGGYVDNPGAMGSGSSPSGMQAVADGRGFSVPAYAAVAAGTYFGHKWKYNKTTGLEWADEHGLFSSDYERQARVEQANEAMTATMAAWRDISASGLGAAAIPDYHAINAAIIATREAARIAEEAARVAWYSSPEYQQMVTDQGALNMMLGHRIIRGNDFPATDTREGTAAAGPGRGRSIRGYAAGTGPEGLPETGLYYGHQGEIVLNPQQSDRVRKGAGAGTQNTYHVTVSPQIMAGDRQSARRVAREIMAALKSQGEMVGR